MFVRSAMGPFQSVTGTAKDEPNGLPAKQDQDTSSNSEDRHDHG